MTLLGRPADDVRKELVASYLSDLGIDRVAAKHGVTKSTVRAALKKFKVPLRSRAEGYAIQSRIPQRSAALICTAYEAGHSLEAIGDRFGVHPSSVAKLLRRNGIRIRSSGSFKTPVEQRIAALEVAAKEGSLVAGRRFGVHHTTILAWPKRTHTRPCDGCGNPATGRFCDWCSLVA